MIAQYKSFLYILTRGQKVTQMRPTRVRQDARIRQGGLTSASEALGASDRALRSALSDLDRPEFSVLYSDLRTLHDLVVARLRSVDAELDEVTHLADGDERCACGAWISAGHIEEGDTTCLACMPPECFAHRTNHDVRCACGGWILATELPAECCRVCQVTEATEIRR